MRCDNLNNAFLPAPATEQTCEVFVFHRTRCLVAYICLELILPGKVCMKITKQNNFPTHTLCALCAFQTLGFEIVGLCCWFSYYVVCSFRGMLLKRRLYNHANKIV